METIKFPLDFKECPVCGSTKRVAEEVAQHEKDEGRVGQNQRAFIYTTQSMIMDPTKTVLSAPVIVAFYDICAECGTFYCVHAQLQKAVIGAGKQPPPKFSTS